MNDTKPADQVEWESLCKAWLDAVQPALRKNGVQLAQGERGVLVMKISRAEMASVIDASHKPGPAFFAPAVDPFWTPFEEFLKGIVTAHEDRSAADRWRPVLETMDPKKDVALFITSAEPEGPLFTRFVVVTDGNAVAH